ncbi:MAG: 50S ribosomal protein L37ae [Candidatus Marsarchaeota archaeon]|nr:50S ribosomal protein L37ae [Candidatus Marsarchaeota archaeon]
MANWSTRYGVNLRKRYLAISKEKKTAYECDVCGKAAVRRLSTGIWKCKHCGATFAGGAYSLKTEVGRTVERLLGQLKKGD